MATAEELLQNLNSESEEHIVIGSDRHIIVPNSLKRIAVQYDHDVETVTFDCPRYWDNIDMSNMAIYINYMRSDKYTDSYPVDAVTIDENDPGIMHFNWTISRNVTEVKGNLTFLVCIKKTDDSGYEYNHWNSELCTSMYVSEGMETNEQVLEAFPDLVTELLLQVNTLAKLYVGSGDMPDGYDIQIDPNGDEYFEVEQTFKPESANPMSGKAVAEAFKNQKVILLDHTLTEEQAGAQYLSFALNAEQVEFLIKAKTLNMHLSFPCENETVSGNMCVRMYVGYSGVYAYYFYQSYFAYAEGKTVDCVGTTHFYDFGRLSDGDRGYQTLISNGTPYYNNSLNNYGNTSGVIGYMRPSNMRDYSPSIEISNDKIPFKAGTKIYWEVKL